MKHSTSTHAHRHLREGAQHLVERVKLSAESRERIRGSLAAFSRENPAAAGVEARGFALASVASPWARLARAAVMFRPMLAGLLIALFLGGGVSYGAEISLPGDSLYWVKTEVNEEVADFVTVSNSARVTWDARKVERRLEEATALAAQGRLDAEARVALEARIGAGLGEFAAAAAAASEDDPDGAHGAVADFEAALRAHEHVLARFDISEDTADSDAEMIARRANAAADALENVRVGIEARASASADYFAAAASKKAAAASREVAAARRALESSQAQVAARNAAEAAATLELALAAYAAAEAEADTKNFHDAFLSYQTAHELAREAKLLVFAGPNAAGDRDSHDDNDEDKEDKKDGRKDNAPKDSVKINWGGGVWSTGSVPVDPKEEGEDDGDEEEGGENGADGEDDSDREDEDEDEDDRDSGDEPDEDDDSGGGGTSVNVEVNVDGNADIRVGTGASVNLF